MLTYVEDARVWHKCFGHIRQNEIIRKQCIVDIQPEKIDFCDSCVEGKHCIDPFSGTRVRAERPF